MHPNDYRHGCAVCDDRRPEPDDSQPGDVQEVRVQRLACVLAGHVEVRNAQRYTVDECEAHGRAFLARCDGDGLPTRAGYNERSRALLAMLEGT